MAQTEEKYSSSTSGNAKGSIDMDWEMIAKCVSHEMYPKIANNIRSIINNKEKCSVTSSQFTDQTIEKVMDAMKSEHLPIEEQTYLLTLFKRAKTYIPITYVNRNS